MPTLSITVTADQAAKLQMAVYAILPELFPVGASVILKRSDNSVLLASDGSADNFRALTDAQYQTLVNNGKPANDDMIAKMSKRFWSERIGTSNEMRANYQRALSLAANVENIE